MFASPDHDADSIDPADAVFVDVGYGLEGDVAVGLCGQPGRFVVLGREDQRGRDQTSRLEALDDLLVTNSAVLLCLIEVEELSPGGGHVLVGGQNRDQGAERE